MIRIALLVVVSIYYAIYSFLPVDLRNNPYIRFLAILSALLLLIYSLWQVIIAYKDHSYAIVLNDGTVSKRKNFLWPIKKIEENKHPVFILEDCFKDPSEVEVVTYKKNS